MSSTKLTISVDEPGATINPNVYGHFAEHIGTCIYEGVWVGEDSAIPNTNGIRNDVAQALKAIKPPVIRWPGGCFADDYHWEDGVGPRDCRPHRVNLHWGQVVETNAFGTHEFVSFCRMVGAEPYICGNVGSGTPRELREWVEYCNYPGASTLALERAANGAEEPLRVKYWGVGNENWGCGGSMGPQDYCTQFRRFATFLRGFGTDMCVIACGPCGNDVNWTAGFFEKLRGGRSFGNIQGYAAHYYCGTAGTSTEYTDQQWYELLHRASRMEQLVVQQRAAMDAYDPGRSIGLIVDEWGAWHPPSSDRKPRRLWQQNTMRDALVAALTLDIFNRHADKVVMGNIAQTINVLQAMILTDGDRMLCTPTYHVYGMYAEHQGAQSLHTHVETDSIDFRAGDSPLSLPRVTGSASVKDKRLTLTLVNAHVSEPAELSIELRGCAGVSGGTATVLASGDIHAHNTFEEPEGVKPETRQLAASKAAFAQTLPAASVVRLSLELT